MTFSRIDVLRTRVARGLHAIPRKSHMLGESTIEARVGARITGMITRFLGGGAKDNSLETILSISRRRARDSAAFGALIGKC